MKESGKRRLYSEQFKKEAAILVTEHGYTIAQAAQVVDAVRRICNGGSSSKRRKEMVNVWMLMNVQNCSVSGER